MVYVFELAIFSFIFFKCTWADPPQVKIDYEKYYTKPGEDVSIGCDCKGYPKSTFKWFWTPCERNPNWPSCSETIELQNDGNSTTNITTWSITPTLQRTEVRFIPMQAGILNCTATNNEGNDTFQTEVLHSDLGVDDLFTIQGVEDNEIIVSGANITLTCGALNYYFSDINWYRNGTLIETGSGWQVNQTQSDYSYRNDLIMDSVSSDKSGKYECRATYRNGSDATMKLTKNLQVRDLMAPIVTYSDMDGGTVSTKLGERHFFQCQFDGIPEPTTSWYKDGMLLKLESSTVLSINYVKPEDKGEYMCKGSNIKGSTQRTAILVITDLPGFSVAAILGIIVTFVLLIFMIIFLCVRFFREKKLRMELKAAGLANFEEGDIECINPALSLDEQANLLPYNRRFEFPKERLKLAEQLGAGAFGVVLRGTAEGILASEDETTVAVKMVSKLADNLTMKALVSELKIMVHLGQHLNIVNLLGAVTKNIAKREAMIIVEFCRFGNIQDFLQKHRTDFVNQINLDTDQIDPYIATFNMELSESYEINSQGLKYLKMPYKRQENVTNSQQSVSNGYIQESAINFLPANNTGYVSANDFLPPSATVQYVRESDVNYVNVNVKLPPVEKPKAVEEVKGLEVTTTNLVSWGFQVARGMDYLASRKVLHGDLAARNILLCDDNVVKICDFGLARSMYKDNYKKKGESLLPFKWLALESMSDHVFSTKSDVWSFGITLWEFFSLARVPYPGMNADQALYFKLRDGYRMEKPEYANNAIYNIMLECWNANPQERPTFNELEKKFSRILGEEITNHYLDLNDPYMRTNSMYLKSGELDFMALMKGPEEPTSETPRYTNAKLVVSNGSVDSSYVQMSPISGSEIFSPRPDDGYVKPDRFPFPESHSPTLEQNLDSQSSKYHKKFIDLESVPMLQREVSLSSPEGSGLSSGTPYVNAVDNLGYDHYLVTGQRSDTQNKKNVGSTMPEGLRVLAS